MRRPLLISTLLVAIIGHRPVEIDNAVLGEPQVQCDSDAISLLFSSKNSFGGKVFVKGYVQDDGCVQTGDQKTAHRFTVKHDSCGVRRQREVNGVMIVTTVIVSFHSIFITKVDRAYKLSCFYVEASKKVSQQLDVASLSTQSLEGQTQLPACRYEILSDVSGPPIKYAHIGDMVYHKWSCASELTDIYCMRVHSCTVNDGQGGPPVTVIDANGCSLDGVILQDLDYQGDLSAGKMAQVFKFADKAGLYFNCQVQLTIKDKILGCSASQPTCVAQTAVEPASKTTEYGSSGEYTESSHESGYLATKSGEAYPTVSSEEYPTTSDGEKSTPSPTVEPYSNNRVLLTLGESHESVGAPGAQPSYGDIRTESSSAVPFQADKDPYAPSKDPYKRLLRRNTRQSVSNRSHPIAVADFDLPERGLIVFGLDEADSHGGNLGDRADALEAAKAFFEDRGSKTCFSTSRIFTLLVVCLTVLATVTISSIVVVYRQRRLISSAFIKA